MHFEARSKGSFLYVFAEPMTEEEIDTLQSRNNEKNKKITRALLGTDENDDVEPEAEDAADWARLRAKVESDISKEQMPGTESPATIEAPPAESFEQTLLQLQASVEKVKIDINEAAEAVEAGGRKPRSEERATSRKLRAAVAKLGNFERNVSIVESQMEDAEGLDPKLLHLTKHVKYMIDTGVLDAADVDSTLVHRTSRIVASRRARAFEKKELEIESSAHTEPTSEESGESPLADSTLSSPPQDDADKPLLALTLTIRNKVNNKPVERPENLTADDIWTVEYLLDEVADGHQAWALYEACKARRKQTFDKDLESAYGLRLFQQEVAKWAAKGKEWRAKRTEEESGKEAQVFEPFDTSG